MGGRLIGDHIRDHVADDHLGIDISSVTDQANRLGDFLLLEFINQGLIEYTDDLEKAALRLRTFADRVRTAPRGYSSLFEAVKINEPELAKLYAYDAALLDKTDEVEHAIDNIQASVGTDGLPAAIRNLQTVSKECIKAYDRRQEVVVVE